MAHIVNIIVHNADTDTQYVQEWEDSALPGVYNGIVFHMRTYDNEAWEYEGGCYNEEFAPVTSLSADFKNRHTGDRLSVTVKFYVDMKVGESSYPVVENIVVSVDRRAELPQKVHVPFDNFAASTPSDGIWDAVHEILQRETV